MKIRNNIKLILQESYRWRHRELLEQAGFVEPILTWKNFIKKNLLLFSTAIVVSLFMFPFVNDQFAGYIISSLSIFVGLFTSVLILIFDKYVSQKKAFEESRNLDSNQVLQQKKVRNFSKQFVYISLEALLIAVTLIALLLVPLLLKERYLENVFEYYFVDIKQINLKNIGIFMINFFSSITRILIIILTFKFIKYLFYIFGSLGAFLMGVFRNHIRL